MRRAALTLTLLTLLLTLALAAPINAAHAADLKIGVVDVEFIIHTSKKGKAAKARLKKMFEEKQKELDSKQKALLEMKKQIESASDMESQDKRRAKIAEYQQGLLQLQEVYLKNQQDLAKKEVELMKPILKSLEEILTKFAADGAYDLIMNRSEQGVLYTKKDHDLTQQVLAKLDGG